MISGRDIIFISSIEWDFLWQGHQEITRRLAAAGNRILYIENTGVRAPGIRDAGRVAKRFKRWGASLRSRGVRRVEENIYVCSPMVLPPFGARWQRELNRQLFLPLVRRAARKLGMKDVLIWTYLPTDTALDLINLLRTPRSVVVYYCVDNFAVLTPQVRKFKASERAVLELSDVVFATYSDLAANCSRWSDNVHIFPSGVDLEAFPLETQTDRDASQDRTTQSPSEGSALRAVPRPIIGYVGGLHRHVDFQMLATMARARPSWSWVFVGAIQTTVGELSSLPNVHLLGQRPHPELVHYIRDFDVCIVPYLDSQYTATVVPTKINEYLAMGKPVVSATLPAVREFNQQYDVLITAIAEPDAFLAAIEQALRAPSNGAVAARRREVAALSDWQTRLEAMSELIEAELQTK